MARDRRLMRPAHRYRRRGLVFTGARQHGIVRGKESVSRGIVADHTYLHESSVRAGSNEFVHAEVY